VSTDYRWHCATCDPAGVRDDAFCKWQVCNNPRPLRRIWLGRAVLIPILSVKDMYELTVEIRHGFEEAASFAEIQWMADHDKHHVQIVDEYWPGKYAEAPIEITAEPTRAEDAAG